MCQQSSRFLWNCRALSIASWKERPRWSSARDGLKALKLATGIRDAIYERLNTVALDLKTARQRVADRWHCIDE